MLSVLPQVRAMGEGGERALIGMFQDRRLENLAWRFEAAILLAGIGSDEGTRMVKALMNRIAQAALIEDIDERYEKFGEVLGNEEAADCLVAHFAGVLIVLEDPALYKKMLWGGYTPKDRRVAAALIQRKPDEFMPVVIDAVAGEELAGRKAGLGVRRKLALFLVRELKEFDEETTARAVEAIQGFVSDAHPVVKAEMVVGLREAGVEVGYETRPMDERTEFALRHVTRKGRFSPAVTEELRKMLADAEGEEAGGPREEPRDVPEEGERGLLEAPQGEPPVSTESGTERTGPAEDGPPLSSEADASPGSASEKAAVPAGAADAGGGAGAARDWILAVGAALIVVGAAVGWLALRRNTGAAAGARRKRR